MTGKQSIVAALLLIVIQLLWQSHRQSSNVVDAGRSTQFLSPEMTLAKVVADIKKSLTTTYNLNNANTIDSIDLKEYVRVSSMAQYRLPAIDLTGAHSYDDEQDKFLSSGIRVTNITLSRNQIDALCASQLQMMLDQLNTSAYIDTLNNYTLMNVLDSWGKPEAGLLRGDRFWLGNYDQCINAYIGGTHAHYCVASLTWNNNKWPSERNNLPVARYNQVKTGVCLPYACDTLAADLQHEQLLIILQSLMGESYTRNMSISSLYCLPDERSQLVRWTHSELASSLVIFVTVWLFIIGACTISEIIVRMLTEKGSKPSKMPPIVRCFSLRNAIRSLLPRRQRALTQAQENAVNAAAGLTSEQQLADMKVLDGLKSFALLGVVGAHTWLLRPISFSSFDGAIYANTMIGRMLISIVPALSVNLFFTITGLVTTYIIFKTRRRVITSGPFWCLFGVHRYMRIIPVWLLAFWMMKCFKYSGSGPLWDYGTSNYTNIRHCEQESWLSVVLMGASLQSPQEHCFVVGWYLANDVLFALTITPIYCILLHKMPRVAYSLVPVSIITSVSYQILRLCSIDADLTAMTRADIQTTSMITLDLGFLYSSPIVRLPYLMIGVVMGHVLIVHEWTDNDVGNLLKATGRAAYQRWAAYIMQVINLFGTRLGAIVVLAGVVTLPEIVRLVPAYFKSLDNNTTVIFFSCPMLYTCSIVFVFVVPPLLMHRFKLSQMLAWPVWTPVSRIALSVLVTHPAIVQYYYMSYTQFIQTPPFIMLQSTVYLIVLSYFGGFVFYCLFEYPFKSLNDIVIRLLVAQGSRASIAAQQRKSSAGLKRAPTTEINLQINGNAMDEQQATYHEQQMNIDMRMLRPPATPEIYRLNLGSNMKRASLAG